MFYVLIPSEPVRYLVRGILIPRGIINTVEIIAWTREYKVGEKHLHLPQQLRSEMQVDLVQNAEAMPSVLVMLNEKSASKNIRLEHGSGHFALVAYESAVLDAEISGGITQVNDLSMSFTDLVTATPWLASRNFMKIILF